MSKMIYLVNDRPKLVYELLSRKGYDIRIGDGTFYDKELLSDCWALMPGRGYITEETLKSAPNLKLIVKTGVGIDRIDVDACTAHGVCVANTPTSNYIAVAEHTVALMLAVTKQLWPISEAVRNNNPNSSCIQKLPATELYGKTLSLIGLGNIGSRVARICAAFGMNIIGYSSSIRPYTPDFVTRVDSLAEAIRKADILSLHIPGKPQNVNIIGKEELALMKPTAFLINTARGNLIDEIALYFALKRREIAGAGLDVLQSEPVTGSNPLLGLDNVIYTPHSASNTEESKLRSFETCAEIIDKFAQGIYPQTAVNQISSNTLSSF